MKQLNGFKCLMILFVVVFAGLFINACTELAVDTATVSTCEDDDEDCDGVLTAYDCDDEDATVTININFDGDCDGVLKLYDCDDTSSANVLSNLTDADGDDVNICNDCNDSDATVTDDITLDADCDGILTDYDCDDTDASIISSNVTDADCDGILTDYDCDDTDASIISSNVTDADCDGIETTYDCDDTDATIITLATDDADCDGIETTYDCDDTDAAVTDNMLLDADCDGVLTSYDCDDTDASIISSNVTDADCDGIETTYDCDDTDGSITSSNVTDADCDGIETTYDCDDTDGSITSSNITDADCDGVDTTYDCDDTDGSITSSNVTDADNDGVSQCYDCDDADASNTLSTADYPSCVETSTTTSTLADYFIALSLSSVSVEGDGTTYTVSSDGFPTHTHTDGIGGWNQRVPLPQDFTGDYAFPFPVNPTLNDDYPEGIKSYLHSSVGLAINGIPIFVPYKQNICEDSSLVDTSSCELLYDETNSSYDRYDTYLVDELDSCGGHSGRGDDYHYHRYPQGDDCLEGLMTTAGLDVDADPWAYAYDGFAIYGPLADSDTDDLDDFNGHEHADDETHQADGVYHYHARTDQRPYVVGGLAGDVSTYTQAVDTYTVTYIDIGDAGTTQSPRTSSDCFEDEPDSSGITFTITTDDSGDEWYEVIAGSAITVSTSGEEVQKTMYRVYEETDGTYLFDFSYYADADDTTSISTCDAVGLSRSSSSSSSSSSTTSTDTLQVDDLVQDSSYHFTSPYFADGYMKWASSSTGEFAASRSTPNFTDTATETEWYQYAAWTLVTSLDGSTTGYSLQSVYDTGYYLYGVAYDSSVDDADIDHVIKVADSSSYSEYTPFLFTVYDASDVNSNYSSGVVIECTGIATGTYVRLVDRSDDNGKDMFCVSGLNNAGVFYVSEYE